MARIDIRTYMKNATKSVAYIATDTLGQLNPALRDFASSNKDLAKGMYESVRDFKKNRNYAVSKVANDEYTKVAGEFVKNTIEDFKTGKWYNKDREDKTAMEAFGFDDWDLDSDFSIGDSEDNDIGISSNDKFMANTIDDVGSKIAKASANATIQSAQYIAESNHASNRVLIKSNEHLAGQVTMGLATVNSTIASFATSIVDPLSTHIKNSTQFYENTTKLLQDQNKMLADTTKLLQDRFEPKKKSNYKTAKDFSYASSGGVPDLANYFDIVKSNIREMTSMYTDMLKMTDMGGKKGSGLRAMTSSPIAMMVGMAAETISKNVVGDAFERFNQTLQGFFGSIIMKINQNQNKYGAIGDLARIFGIKSTLKKNIDTSKYEKGRVDFDGITRKSIVEVMPTQLAKIVAALTGEPEQRFDYKTGKFVTVHSIKKEREKLTRRYSNSASSDMQRSFDDYINKIEFETRQQKEQFQEDIEKFFESLFTNAKMYDYKSFDKEKADSLAKDYGNIDPKTLKIITEFYRANEKNKKGYVNLGVNGEIFSQRSSLTRALEQEEKSGDSLYTHLYNDSFDASRIMPNNKKTRALGMLGIEDDKGNNVFFYLQNFYSDIKKIVRNTSDGFGGGPSGGKSPKSKRRYSDKDFAVPNNVKNYKTPEEIRDEEQEKAKDEYFESVNKRIRETNKSIKYNNLVGMDTDAIQAAIKPDTYTTLRQKEKQKAEDYKKLYKQFIDKGHDEEEASKRASEITGYTPKDGFAKEFSTAETIGDKIDAIKNSLASKFNPSGAVAKILDSVDTHLYNMIYGKDADPEDHNSIIGRLFNKIDEGFNDFFAKMKDKAAKFFGETLGLNRLKEKLFGEKGFFRPFMNSVKGEFKSVGGWLKGAVSSTGKAIMQPFANSNVGGFATVDQAYCGGIVKRTGLAAVSEGELIIPSEYNPLYTGTNNKTVQKSRELKAKSNFYRGAGSNLPYFGQYAEGGFAGKAKEAFNSFRAQGMDAKDAVNKAAEALGVDPQDIIDKLGSVASTISSFATASGKILFNGAVEAKDRLFGNSKDDNKAFGEATADVIANLKKYAPSMVTGGIIGAGVSLVGGIVGGPLLGAAAGAATSLVIKSNKVQDWLFGKIDDKTGDRQGGVFNSKLSNYLTKTFPEIAKFGATGALASLIPGIPGGPIAGMLVGSALGTMWKNQKFQDWLFGNEEAGIKGKIDKEHLKKIAPNIGAGAIAGLVAGPFGLVGNLMIGSALGYASTTDKFKHAIFGEPDANGEYHGGLLGYIKDDVIDPLKQYLKDNTKSAFDYIQEKFVNNLTDAIKPIGRQIELLFSAAGKALKTQFKTHVTIPIGRSIEKWIIKPAAGLLGGIFKKTIKPVVDIASIPFRAVGKAGRALQKRQVEKGTATYMTAAERVEYRSKNKMNTDTSQAKLDEMLSGMNQDELLDMQNQFNTSRRAFGKLGKEYDQASGEFSKRLESVNMPMSKRKQIKKALNSGNYEAANKVISGLNIDENNKKMLTDEVGNLSKKIGSADQLSKVLNADQNKIFETLKEKGIDVNSKNFGKIQDLINVEAKGAKTKAKTIENLPTDEKIEYKVSNIYDEIVKVNANLENIIKGKGSKTPEGKDDSEKKDGILPSLSQKDGYEKKNDIIPGLPQKQDGEEGQQESGKEGETSISGKKRWKIPWPFKKNKVDYNFANDNVQEQFKTVFESLSRYGMSDDKANQMAKEIVAPDGTVLRYRKDARNGKVELDKSDPATAQYLKDKNADKSFKTKLLEKVSGLGFLKGIFDKLSGKGGDKEKKKGIFSKIGDFLGSTFSGLVGALGGLIPALSGAAGLLLTVLGWKHGSKLMDNLEDKVIGRTEEDKEKYDIQPYMSENIEKRGVGVNFLLKGQNASKLVKGKGPVSFVARNALKVAEYGRDKIKTGAGKVISKAASSKTFGKVKAGVGKVMTNMFSSEAYRDTLESLVASGMDKDQALRMAKENLGGTKGGIIADKISSLASKSKTVNKAVTAVSKVVGEDGIVQLLKSKVSGLFEKITGLSFIKNKIPSGFIENIVEKFVPQWAKVLAEKGATKVAGGLAKTIAKIGPIGIAVAITDFITGFQDARSILGIIDKPTVFQRLLSGLAKSLNGLIPVVGGIIPTEYIMDLLINVLDGLTPFDMSGIKAQRAQAQEVVDAYNKENNTHMTVREYCKNVLDDHTITEKIGSAVKSAGNWIAEKVTNKSSNTKTIQPVKEKRPKVNNGEAYQEKSASTTINNISKETADIIDKPTEVIKTDSTSSYAIQPIKVDTGVNTNSISIPTGFNNTQIPSAAAQVGSGSGNNNTAIRGINDSSVLVGMAENQIISIFKKVDNKFEDPSDFVKRLYKYGDSDKKMSQFYTEQIQTGKDSPFAGIATIASDVIKTIMGPIVIVRKITKPLRDIANNIKEWFNDDNSIIGKIKNFFSGLINNDSGSDSTTESTGGGSFVSQKDPQYNNQRYGNSTIGDIGCGPATAAMVINQTTGRNMSLSEAANYATRRGYVAGGASGTRSGYFEDIFGQYGLSTRYADRQSDINKSLSSGKPTILLGQDRANTSKSKSPFGPNPHYVVANGYDRSGNVIINDPELNGPVKYSKNILNKTKLGVSVGAGSRLQQMLGGASLLTLTNEIISENEGSYDSVNANDKGSMSIGKMQWNANSGRAQPLLRAIIEKNPSNAKSILGDALYSNIMNTNWSNAGRIASSDEASKIKALLQTNESKQTQDELITQDLNKYINSGKSAGISDKKALIYYADYINQYGSAGELIRQATSKAGSTSAITLDVLHSVGKNMSGGDYITRRTNTYNKLNAITDTITDDGTIDLTTAQSSSGSTLATTSSTPAKSNNPFSNGISGFLDTIFKSIGQKMFGGTEKGNAFLGLLGLADTEESTDDNSEGLSRGESKFKSAGALKNDFPYFDQSNPLWANRMYSATNDTSQTMASSGCGPTSMAMILKSFGNNVTPVETAQWAVKNNYRTPKIGTSWGYFPAIAKEYGLTGVDLGKNDKAMADSLKAGFPIIASMTPTTFTQSGHFIVLSGVDDQGNIMVNDPAGQKGKARSERTWPLSIFEKEAKNYWSFNKDGVGSITMGNNGDASLTEKDSTINIPKAEDKYPEPGGSSGLLSKPKSSNVLNYVAAGSGLSTNQQILLEKSGRQLRNKVGAGASNDEILVLIKSIIQVLQNISNNTYKINNIISVLTNYFNSKSGSTGATTDAQSQQTAQMALNTGIQQAKDIQSSANVTQDQDIQQLMKMLTAIASS